VSPDTLIVPVLALYIALPVVADTVPPETLIVPVPALYIALPVPVFSTVPPDMLITGASAPWNIA
jgi:hypothetical protein